MSKIKALILFSLLVLFLLIPKLSTFPESITFTTYYPSPFGVYSQLRSKKMAIGDTYYDSSQHCWPGGPCTFPDIDADADLIVEGNVGIGTTDPGAKLEVNVGLNALKIGGRDTYVDSSEDPANANIYVTQAGVGDFSQLAGSLVLQARTQGTVYRDIIFAGGLSNGDALMTILGEGNVGIGTTAPTAALHIVHANPTHGGLYLDNEYAAGGAYNTHFDYPDGKNYIRGTTILGEFGYNVGIGTTNPGATLEVNGHSKSKATIVGVYNAATGEDFRFFDVSNYGAIQINSGHSDIYSFRNGKRGQILYIYGAAGSGSFTIYHGVDIPYHCHTSAGAPKTISGHGGAIIIFAADDGHSFVMATYP